MTGFTDAQPPRWGKAFRRSGLPLARDDAGMLRPYGMIRGASA